MQSTHHILLVRPVASGFNPETATSNTFQRKPDLDDRAILDKVLAEFEAFVTGLQAKGVEVEVIDDTILPAKPDAIFPNNWITFHADGRVILYPMLAKSRRQERRLDVLEQLKTKFLIREVIDLSEYEKMNKYLEGTGSMVFDHVNKVAYACLSPRTDKELFLSVCGLLDYRPVYFHAHDEQGKEIYHTNVMMCIGDGFCVICLSSITDLADRKHVVDSLRDANHTIIDISCHQMNHFAGNMLSVRTNTGGSILVCSRQAADSLTGEQRQTISRYTELVPLAIPTIEMLGGGSARCMMAEVFLPMITA